jgi:hypothetical protein
MHSVQRRELSWSSLFGGSNAAAGGDAAAASQMSAEIAGLASQSSSSTASAAAAATARPSFASTVEGAGRPQSVVERMDNAWSGFFENMGIPHFGFIDSGATWLAVFEATTGYSWTTTMFLFGVGIRLATLGFSLYGERAAIRMALATAEVKPEFDAFQQVYRSAESTQLDIANAAEHLRVARNAAFVKHHTSNKATLVPMLGSPLFMYGFTVVVRAMNEGPRSIPAALLMPDPTGATACAAVLMTLANFELTFARKRAGATNTTGLMSKVPWVARAIAAISLPVVMEFRTGTVVYWCGLSLAGLLQPLLMGLPQFRRWYGVPDIQPGLMGSSSIPSVVTKRDVVNLIDEPKAPADGEQAGIDTLEQRFEQRFPRLSLLLRPGAALKAAEDYLASKERARLKHRVQQPLHLRQWRRPAMDKHGIEKADQAADEPRTKTP